MLSVEQALDLVKQNCDVLAPRWVSLGDAVGLVLAGDIASDIDSPPHDKAMMDGYAVRSVDRMPERRIVDEIAAGAVPHVPLTAGTAARIMTGAPLPPGGDAVVPVEQTELIDVATVRLHHPELQPGQHVLPLGAAMRAGDTVLRRGAVIRPAEIAILAETGHARVLAHPRPNLAVVTTGNELVDVDQKPSAGQIRNSNSPMLVAAAKRAGADAAELPTARDTPEDLTNRIQQALDADILLLSGGVSAGKFDLVPQVLREQGVEQVFHKIALRPGKPLWFGVKRHRHVEGKHTTYVFGLPGNPVSSLVCFEVFVRPAIAALSGRGFVQLDAVRAKLHNSYDHTGGRAACLPALLTASKSELNVEILPWQGSADLAALARANGLVRLRAEPQSIESGTVLDVLPL